MASPQTSALSDPDRLATLRASGLLDSEPEEAFDRYTRLAARLLDVPVAFVSLVAADRQFFKSQVGLPPALREPRETPLSLSLCKHAVERREPVRLGDLRENSVPEASAVLDETGLGSFLGAPLLAGDGTCLGSLSVMDEEPREW
ncbi:MAG: GAF domain-containing protein, partial [Gemmatimonadota bacterium]